MQRRRSIAAVLGFALALFGLAGPHVTKATAADRTATLVGTLQDELAAAPTGTRGARRPT